ncbi:MAG: DNA polymerase III subunit alpha [Marinifilaceae bacterium]
MYLNCHSYYSLRYGTLSVERLVKLARRNGVRKLVLTDINNSTGMIDFVKYCKEEGIEPVGGIDFRNQNRQLYVGIARNNDGFRELNEFLSDHLIHKKELPDRAPEFRNCFVVYPWKAVEFDTLRAHEFMGVGVQQLNRIQFVVPPHCMDKLVVHQPVSFASAEEYELHRNLRAIDNNCLLDLLPPEQVGASSEQMIPFGELQKVFAGFSNIGKNTCQLLDKCHINFEFKKVKNKQTFTGCKEDDRLLLEKLALEGWHYRYGDYADALNRVRHELKIIHELGFSAYFLITWDIIRYSMSRGFYHVGRGSGANSVVAYCLKITDVDPIELDLYFERFINPKRSSPPDFDIDFSWKEREEVQDYIFKRYGQEHTAFLGTMSTFKGKSILRELGKVHGLPKQEIDLLIKDPENSMNQNEVCRRILRIGRMMTDFPNLRSIHAGGILVSEESITSYTALDMPPKGFPTTQWDMYAAEEIGFEKIDILSQRGLGHIQDCVEIVRENCGVDVDIHKVDEFKVNPKVKQQLKSGETIGCFYIESPAMRGLLKKLRCDNYLSLVAASSIIRPGVARSGMMREYIHRFHNPGKFKYLHPVMKEQLEETYGVMVYQEDVLKVCHHFAGLDLADADVLRRAMSGKYRSRKEFQKIIDKFFSNCKERGYSDELAKEVWRQIESFAGYSFSKAHSASYAVESYQSLYLKAHFPLEFMVAVINNFGGFYRSWVYVNEAKRWGANILLPCVNHSEHLVCIKGKDVYLGFVLLANFERKMSRALVEERAGNGVYKNLEDFIHRVPIKREQLLLLIRIGAFRFTGKPKADLMWEAHMHFSDRKEEKTQTELFAQPRRDFVLPTLESNPLEDAYDEMELLGFPVSISYMDLLQTSFRGQVTASTLLDNVGKTIKLVGVLVCIKYVKTVRKELMHFGTFLDQKGEFFDTVHFPNTLKEYPFRGHGVYLILGEVTQEFGYPSITVQKLAKLPIKSDPREQD